MQVYVLLTDGTQAIIPKKAEKNNLWQNISHPTAKIVNQAGQYVLFGGRVERGDSIENTAIKEVSEESGIDIRSYEHQVDTLLKTGNYTCLTYTFSPKDFQNISRGIAENISNKNVADGEMQSILVTKLTDVRRLLGIRQKISGPIQAEIDREINRNSRYIYNHAIDWYGEIGTECTKRYLFAPSKKKQSIASRLAAGRQRKLVDNLDIITSLSPDTSIASSERTTPDDVSYTSSLISPDEHSRLIKDSGSPHSLKFSSFNSPETDSPDNLHVDMIEISKSFSNIPVTPPRAISRSQSGNILTPAASKAGSTSVENLSNISPSYPAEKFVSTPSGTKLTSNTGGFTSPKDRKKARENQENTDIISSIDSLTERLRRAGMKALPDDDERLSQMPSIGRVTRRSRNEEL